MSSMELRVDESCSDRSEELEAGFDSDPVLLCPPSCIIFNSYCLNCRHHLTDCTFGELIN